MRGLRQIIVGFLALSLAVGGLVGISPDLHRLLEHGGKGPAHTHRSLALAPEILVHGHTHGTERGGEWHSAKSAMSNRRFAHSDGAFELPTAELANVFQRLYGLLTGEPVHTGDTAPPESGHHHESLAQLLASGLAEQVVEFPPMQHGGIWFVVGELTTDGRVPKCEWNAQTASRGPPAV